MAPIAYPQCREPPNSWRLKRAASADLCAASGRSSASNAVARTVNRSIQCNTRPECTTRVTLGVLGNPDAVPPIMKLLQGPFYSDSPIEAISQLGRLDNPAVLDWIQHRPKTALSVIQSATRYQSSIAALVHLAAVRSGYLEHLRLLDAIRRWDGNRATVDSKCNVRYFRRSHQIDRATCGRACSPTILYP